jgi:hypothetical protein
MSSYADAILCKEWRTRLAIFDLYRSAEWSSWVGQLETLRSITID